MQDGFHIANNRPFALEGFCGSARLTKHMRAYGINCWGVDWAGCRFNQESGAVLTLNLSKDKDQKRLFRLLEHPSLTCVTMAPPCGTSSQARGIPLPDGSPGPPPLRTVDYPMGLPDVLSSNSKDAAKVRTANVLYSLAAKVAAFCDARGIPWMIENPAKASCGGMRICSLSPSRATLHSYISRTAPMEGDGQSGQACSTRQTSGYTS